MVQNIYYIYVEEHNVNYDTPIMFLRHSTRYWFPLFTICHTLCSMRHSCLIFISKQETWIYTVAYEILMCQQLYCKIKRAIQCRKCRLFDVKKKKCPSTFQPRAKEILFTLERPRTNRTAAKEKRRKEGVVRKCSLHFEGTRSGWDTKSLEIIAYPNLPGRSQ